MNRPPNPALRPGNTRRFLAIAALCAGLGAAWWQSSGGQETVQASFLLSRVTPITGVDGGRERLTALRIIVPTEDASVAAFTHTIDFRLGSAPLATSAVALELPSGVTQLEVKCRFNLGGDATTWTLSHVPVDRERDDIQVVDVGSCSDGR